MEKEDLEFVLAALPEGRTVFHDYDDRFAVLLLTHQLQKGPLSVSDLKRSHLAPLLKKPVIRNIVARLGRPQLEAADLLDSWPTRVDAYRLTLDGWPAKSVKPRRNWHQVTRQGYSLVLQLNLPVSHRKKLDQSIEDWRSYTSEGFHPVASKELTLAWARIDLDFARDEALIEEIQSDWVREVKYYAESRRNRNRPAWNAYYTNYLAPRSKHWPRTILTATLWFLLEELGIKTIFFHTHDSGIRLKQIKYRSPPRSIYTDLPRTFCFKTTHNGPAFLRDSSDKHIKQLFTDPETKWYVHSFS